ncbi:ParA family protein [Phototrophicus methaneseepsis]|uniref:ParA family protein n=1 Tax=Phototrophicus methaneseepsis TaxID=2710758 RepID=A0A7S8E607_9CHLR|nr:ParA family protein [Phototrophicus methaneseepsis]QPC81033.1 ParA family protein [Phototrophicus methaneseepsis]
MIVITLLNEKGGVGKTTWADHIARALAARGKRVLLIDLDPQGHATLRTGLKWDSGIYDLLVREESWEYALEPIQPEKFSIPRERLSRGKLWVLPSNRETRFVGLAGLNTFILAKRLKELEGQIDLVVIDSSPTPSPLHALAYMATDYIVYPTECAFLSMSGLGQSLLARQLADKNKEDELKRSDWPIEKISHISVAGILPTKFKANTIEHTENLDKLHQQFGDFVWPEIRNRVIWDTSSSYCLPVFNLEPRSKAAAEVWEVADRVEEVLNA